MNNLDYAYMQLEKMDEYKSTLIEHILKNVDRPEINITELQRILGIAPGTIQNLKMCRGISVTKLLHTYHLINEYFGAVVFECDSSESIQNEVEQKEIK